MAFEPIEKNPAEMPVKIARHTALTAKEKIEMLHDLKAKATGVTASGAPAGLDPQHIDAAIEEVRISAQQGEHPFVPPEENTDAG